MIQKATRPAPVRQADPTPKQIAVRAAKIRRAWPRRVAEDRFVGPNVVPVEIPVVDHRLLGLDEEWAG